MEEKELNSQYISEVLDICLKAGRLMVEGGSEMYRVEDTMLRISNNAGIKEGRCFSTPTGILMSVAGQSATQIAQIRDRNFNLELVDRVNNLSREFANQQITLQELKIKLEKVAKATPNFPIWLQIFGAVILSCTLMILFMNDYDWLDFPAAAFVGGTGYALFLFIKRFTNIRFLSELVTTIFMGGLTITICHFFSGLSVDNILIGGLMALVPGVAITNALRDLFGGDLLSGITRGVEAVLTAVALGGGIGIAMKVFGRLL